MTYGMTSVAVPPSGVAGGQAALDDCTAQQPIVTVAACPGWPTAW
jgi:hypothetical protein